jgi:4-hydroxy-2-oxoheptanedioate aldolase
MQHGVVDYQPMVGMLQAISTTDTVPLVPRSRGSSPAS